MSVLATEALLATFYSLMTVIPSCQNSPYSSSFETVLKLALEPFLFKAEFTYSPFNSPLLAMAVRANLIAVVNELGSQKLILKSHLPLSGIGCSFGEHRKLEICTLCVCVLIILKQV